jgi:GNAT superfamily N-acetyltransferase
VPGSPFRSEPLATHHDRTQFSCGVEALDRYLREQAMQDLRRGLAVPYVLIDTATGSLSGYYTLGVFALDATILPEVDRRRVGHYPLVPAIIIGRLARDLRFRGRGIGGLLLVDACRRIQSLARELGTWGVIVDAKTDEVRGFYERFGFKQTVDDEHRLYLPVRTIASVPGLSVADLE